MFEKPIKNQYFLMMMAGALLGLCFSHTFLYLFSLVPLIYYFKVMSKEYSIKKALLLQLSFTWPMYIVGLAFLVYIYPMSFLEVSPIVAGALIGIGWIGLSLLLSGLYLLLPLLTQILNISETRRGVLLVLGWGLIEVILTWVGFPWLVLGNFTLFSISLAQVASVGSVYLNGLLWLLVAFILTQGLVKREYKWFGMVLVMLLIWWGCGSLLMQVSEVKNTYDVALIQGNISYKDKWEDSKLMENEMLHLDLLTSISSDKEAIFMAESIFTDTTYEESDLYQAIIQLPAFYGTIQTRGKDTYNVLCSTTSSPCYAKRYLVPFGEYMPRWATNLLPFLNDFQLAGALSKGEENTLLHSKIGKVSALLCFESIFPLTANQEGDFLYIASNDSWFDGSSEQFQHLQHARMRAIEQGGDTLRVGNTGITCIIDRQGRIVKQLPSYEAGVLEGEVHSYFHASLLNTFPWIRKGLIGVSLLALLGLCYGKVSKAKWLELKLGLYPKR